LTTSDTTVVGQTASYVGLSYWMGIDNAFFYLLGSPTTYSSCGTIVGYHAMTITGQFFYSWLQVRNSWGIFWGNYGYFYLSTGAWSSCQVQNDFAFSTFSSSSSSSSSYESYSLSKTLFNFGSSSPSDTILIPKPDGDSNSFYYYLICDIIIISLLTICSGYAIWKLYCRRNKKITDSNGNEYTLLPDKSNKYGSTSTSTL
jgi:hypothetical protein